MQLIGMLDSPYVRRVAISLEFLGIPFEHKAVSVFSTFEQFQAINPVVKAPSLICVDGEVLMDSSLILKYAEHLTGFTKSLWSKELIVVQHECRIVGLALAACEKSVQIVYERNLRPKEAQYEPWMTRVEGQLLAAYKGLEVEAGERSHIFTKLNQASITTAVAWQFTQSMLSHIVIPSDYPNIATLSEKLEQTAEFKKYPPTGPGVKAKWEALKK